MIKLTTANHIVLVTAASLWQSAIAFCPRALVVTTSTRTPCDRLSDKMPQPLGMMNLDQVEDVATTAAAATTSSSSSSTLAIGSDALDILKNVALVGGVLVAVLVGLAALFANVVIPQAAEQLELQAKRDYPDLWEKYAVANLQPGEQLVQRPDIMQALGTAVQQRVAADFDAAQAKAEQAKKQTDGLLDAEVIKDDKEN